MHNWQLQTIFKKVPTLTQSDKLLYKKVPLYNPQPNDYWNFFMANNLPVYLEQMIADDTNPQTTNIDGKNLALVAINNNYYKMLQLALKYKVSLTTTDITMNDCFSDSCYSFVSFRLFKLVWQTLTPTEIAAALEQLYLVSAEDGVTHDRPIDRILRFDSNLKKLKFIVKNVPTAYLNENKQQWIDLANKNQNQELVYFLTGKETLKEKLYTNLVNKSSQHKKIGNLVKV